MEKKSTRTISPPARTFTQNEGLVHMQAARPDGSPRWLSFRNPQRILQTTNLREVAAIIQEVDTATQSGLYAAGFIAYEAAAAFDPALRTHPPSPRMPLVWFGIYDKVEETGKMPPPSRQPERPDWSPSLSADAYDEAIMNIKDAIARGETYQVNYSIRLHAALEDDPLAYFHQLCAAHSNGYSAYIDAGGQALCSISPELFFRLDGNRIECRPMKGTAPRGRTGEQDRERARWLQHSAKNRAENVMIVDMIRNDLGRIAHTGSVKVDRLFEVEKFETLFQMTSSVSARTDASLYEIFSALFPCASITGAPKIKTMEIIAGLETEPRGIYTGCLGYIGPGRKAQFNVGIRTLGLDRETSRAIYGIGGGIVWDSEASSEYEECFVKARVVLDSPQTFQLLETLLWTPDEGYAYLDQHIKRVLDSADYFLYPLDESELRNVLEALAGSMGNQPHRVRILVDKTGTIQAEYAVIHPEKNPGMLQVVLANEPVVDISDPFLYHKTTQRRLYEQNLAEHPEADDVILWNDKGEVTESCLANIVIEKEGRKITPPITCGLLAGTMRAALLEAGDIQEGIVLRKDLPKADALFIINSVRGWRKAELQNHV